MVDPDQTRAQSISELMRCFCASVVWLRCDALEGLRLAALECRPTSVAVVLDGGRQTLPAIKLAVEQCMCKGMTAPKRVIAMAAPSAIAEAQSVLGIPVLALPPLHSQLQRVLTPVDDGDNDLLILRGRLLPENSLPFDEDSLLAELTTVAVLAVDDNPINLTLISTMLRKLGIASDRVDNGDEAVAMCSAKQYRGVLLDCNMPAKDGCSSAFFHFLLDFLYRDVAQGFYIQWVYTVLRGKHILSPTG